MPSISICMIVRNEERLLPEFLKGIEGCFDQLVVVDTGSRDGTVDIMTAAGAEVHAMPWQDDFALARNESLRHARGEFVLVLDADEFATPAFRDELRATVTDTGVGAATIHRADEQRHHHRKAQEQKHDHRAEDGGGHGRSSAAPCGSAGA